MLPEDYQFVAALLKARAGLTVNPDRTFLIETRLRPVALRRGLPSLARLVADLRARAAAGQPDAEAERTVVEAMLIHETQFFRDAAVFDQVVRVALPHLARRRQGKALRIWCAACSSGQEPYSLALSLAERPDLAAGAAVEIIGTDLSRPVLERAAAGLYSQFEVQRGLPVRLLVRHFERQSDQWALIEALRRSTRFAVFNLMEDPRQLGQFDLVLCRNVLIYFDPETRRQVLERIAGVLAPDGLLVLGAAETILGQGPAFRLLPGLRGLYGLAGGPPVRPVSAA